MLRNIEFSCSDIDITPIHGYSINVVASDADIDEVIIDILGEIQPKDIVDNCDIGELLDAIGIDECKKYFDLEEIDG